ncbi:MAG: hypothetical protein ABIT16_04445 [Croceibacterium sp.]
MDAKQELVSFIGASFRSVWALELMCLLRSDRRTGRSSDDLVEALRASDLVVGTSLAELVAAGLVSIDEKGMAVYAPATDELDRMAGRAEAHYAKSPDAVRRIIIRAANPGPTAFSDAFKLGGGK